MSAADLPVLLPIIVIAVVSVTAMTVVAFYRNHSLTAGLTLAGLIAAFFLLPATAASLPRQVTPLLCMDRYAFFFMGLLFISSFFVVVLSYVYLKDQPESHEEFYILVLIATLGTAVLAGSSHFASFFLGLELLSISLYSLIAYRRADESGNEAGVKYLVLAAASSAFLLFGMALVYAETGTMQFSKIAEVVSGLSSPSLLLLAGLALITVGVGFKLALVPFHMWTPDVYEGAPAPVGAFIATISKGAVFALLLRYFTLVSLSRFPSIVLVFSCIAMASILVGNLLALVQNNIKRILAYSSIAHMGYMFIAFLAGGSAGVTAASYYLAAYFITIIGAFGIISVLSQGEKDADSLDEYRGLAWRRPWLAAMLTLTMFSLAGIPLTAGFLGKFFVVATGVGAMLWLLLIVLVIGSTIGLYYYLRIISALYARMPDGQGVNVAEPRLSLAGGAVLTVLALLIIWLGVYPSPLLHLIKLTSAQLYQ